MEFRAQGGPKGASGDFWGFGGWRASGLFFRAL